MKTALVSSLNFCAAETASSKVEPTNYTFNHYPPCLFTLLTLSLGVFEGINIVPLISKRRQQYAIPWAWLPALAVVTPLSLYYWVSLRNAVAAPLILKLLTGWRSYLLRKTLALYFLERKADFCSLVWVTIDLFLR